MELSGPKFKKFYEGTFRARKKIHFEKHSDISGNGSF